MKTRPLEDRFFEKVYKTESCWLWMGSRTPIGPRGNYGYMGKTGERKNISTHRASWQIHYGPIPKGMCVLHKCDNPPCCNPEHLFLGTLFDNQQDCVKKKRHANARKLFCNYGHEFTEENTFIYSNGKKRACKICKQRIKREIRAREKHARTD